MEQKEWKPLFPGTDPKPAVKEQRRYCMSQLEQAAKVLAQMEGILLKLQKEFAEVETKYRQYEENYRFMRSPEACIVSLKEFQYVQIQCRDFKAKYEEMNEQLVASKEQVDSTRDLVNNLRRNVIYLDEAIRSIKVVDFNGYKRRRGIEVTHSE